MPAHESPLTFQLSPTLLQTRLRPRRGGRYPNARAGGRLALTRARERLQGVSVIRRVTVAALSRQEATVAIDYSGTIEQLKSELAKISLGLVRRESQWQLARDGSGGTP